MAQCPNCGAGLEVTANECKKCGALFGPGSSWKPLPSAVTINASDLADLCDRECVVIESGRGTIAIVRAFREDGARLYADLETTHSTMFEMNRIRINGEPAIAGWHDVSNRVGKLTTIFQPKENVSRPAHAYVYFSSPYGGARLLFIDEYVHKVRRRDIDGWEWDELMEKARAGTQGPDGVDGA